MFKSSKIAWLVWVVASIFYAYQYILRVMPSVMLPEIMQQFHIDAAIFGQFSGIYYVGYALMHLPIGILLDRIGPRQVMTVCILFTVIGLMPILFASHWVYPILGRALIGIGSSAAILGLFKIIRIGFAEKRFTRMLSFSVTIGLIGAIYGGQPMGYLCSIWGYQLVVEIFMVVGLFLAAITYFIIPEIDSVTTSKLSADIKRVLANQRVWLLCIAAGLMVGPLEGFADVWGGIFYKQVYGLPPATASYLPSLIFMGMCFGAPILNLIAERSANYGATIIGASCTMLIIFIMLVIGWLSVSTIAIAIGSILIGVSSAYQILAIYQVSTYVPERMVGITSAIANMIIMSFGYAFHATIGMVIKISGGPQAVHALEYGIAVIPVGLFLGMLGFMLLMYTDRHSK